MFVQQLNLVSILLPFQSPIPLYLSVVSSGIGSASPHRPSSSPRSDPSSSASPAPPCRRWCRSRLGCRLSPKPRCSSSVQPGPTKGTVRPDVLTSQQLPQLPGHGRPDEVLRLPAHSQHLPATRDRLPDAAQVVDVARCCQPPPGPSPPQPLLPDGPAQPVCPPAQVLPSCLGPLSDPAPAALPARSLVLVSSSLSAQPSSHSNPRSQVGTALGIMH